MHVFKSYRFQTTYYIVWTAYVYLVLFHFAIGCKAKSFQCHLEFWVFFSFEFRLLFWHSTLWRVFLWFNNFQGSMWREIFSLVHNNSSNQVQSSKIFKKCFFMFSIRQSSELFESYRKSKILCSLKGIWSKFNFQINDLFEM